MLDFNDAGPQFVEQPPFDLDALIECARLAEDVVGHPLPGSVKTGGRLLTRRRGIADASA